MIKDKCFIPQTCTKKVVVVSEVFVKRRLKGIGVRAQVQKRRRGCPACTLQHLSCYRRYARACLNDDGVAITKEVREETDNAGFITGNSNLRGDAFGRG